MKWTSATALLVALSAAGAGATYVMTRRPMGPTEIIKNVRAEMGTVTFEQRSALSQLALALRAAEDRRDELLVAEVLQTRAEVYLELGDSENGLLDLKRISAIRPRDYDLRLQIARLTAESGDVEVALGSARTMATEQPTLAAAWALQGELETKLALVELEPFLEETRAGLVREDAELACRLLIRLACRDENDPRNPTLEFELDEAFPPSNSDVLYEARNVVPAVRQRLAVARRAFARSIELEPSPERVLALCSSLEDADQAALAIQVLMASQNVPSLQGSDALKFGLVKLLNETQRVDEARVILRKTSWDRVDDLEYISYAAALLFKAGDYGLLTKLANGLRRLGGDTGVYWARLYRHIGPISQALADEDRASWRDKMGNAMKDLRAFIAEETFPEPFEGAQAHAGFWLAKVALILDDAELEISGLERGLGRTELRTADYCKQLADALARRTPVPWLEIDLALSDAIDLEPARHAEFSDAWLDAGRKTIESKGMTTSDLIGEANRSNSAIPLTRGLGPAAYMLLARKHMEDGKHYASLQAANRALKDHPRLIPALDMAIKAKLVTPNRYNVERDIVRRVELAGIDDDVEEYLNRLPAGRFDGRSMIAAIEASPDRFGKAAVASWFLENGDSASARAALGRLDQRTAPDSLRLLRARTLVEEGRFNAALEDITAIEASRRLGQEAALLKARILVELDRPGPLAKIVRQLDWVQASQDTLLSLADLLMSSGQLELALELVDGLDRTPETRTEAFYRRRVLVDLLTARTRGLETAREAIDRSEAYLRDGTPEIASILLSVSRRKWTELPKQIERLRASNFEITPQKDVALVLLAERLEAGRRLASAGLERNPRDPMWAMVTAASDAMANAPISLPAWFGQSSASDAERLLSGTVARSNRDPRETLAILLIADRPEWSAWLLPVLRTLSEETGSKIWTSYLEARIREASGDVNGMTAVVDRLVEKHRRFGPAHEWSIELSEARNPAEPMHPEVVRARRMRLASLGAELIDDPVEVALAEASDLARRNDNASAVAKLRSVLAEAGDSEVEARLILGILMIRASQPSFAANYLHDAALGDPGIFQTVVVDSLLYSLRYAVKAEEDGIKQRGAIGKARALEMLGELSERYPLDPMIMLARLELSQIPKQSWGESAKRALDALYTDSDRRPLEQLRRGSTRRWVELLSEIQIDLARDIVERDLVHEPGNLELWNLRAEIATAMEDDEAAAGIYRALLAIDPRGEVGYALAEILIERGASIKEVVSVLTDADRAQNGGGNRSLFLRSLAQTRQFKPDLNQMIQRLRGVWSARNRAGSGVDPVRLGELYVDVMMRRNGPGDIMPISKVLEALTEMADETPYRLETVRAINGLFTRAQQEAGTS